jgi:acetyltransferase-like isoleucine patch superfamily enzyme
MFSTDIYVESGAGHDLVVDGKYNEPQELVIGNHVWVGLGAKILAGSGLQDGSMVAAGSVVTKMFSSQELVAGNPAKSLRTSIEWSRDYTTYKKIYHTTQTES